MNILWNNDRAGMTITGDGIEINLCQANYGHVAEDWQLNPGTREANKPVFLGFAIDEVRAALAFLENLQARQNLITERAQLIARLSEIEQHLTT